MTTQILITIDTELAWRHFRPGENWHRLFDRSCEPAGVGISYQLELLRRHDLKACFFVDPMPALVFGLDPIRRMVAPVVEAGQEVQLHLHSFWHDVAAGEDEKPRFHLTDFDGPDQLRLIETASNLLIAAGAPSPVAFRSGSYAADSRTLGALRELGIHFDSSHNGAAAPWPSALPFAADLIDPVRDHGVNEIPVSLMRRRNGALRPLQLCAISSAEMQSAMRHAEAEDHGLVTIVSHSFELATRDGRRINQVVRKRFDGLIAFLAAHRSQFPTTSFTALDALPESSGSQPMEACPLQTAGRVAEQFWADARYERPATAATAIGGTPLSTLDLLPLVGL
ncbi:polysaccharide deacetylase family protein [Sphingosinicella rhizophila]|uniref:Polysaccharide deacetylase n=1 Tax=Sphingosinicella rhizophila TaxID=3050082 RepID=A0ABU3Q597_9SPHN|nr:polysaccharide deacetylase [Sphingosinicella sp. GR2756]MDT9598583.1 polysaccharide deacetylase [Sphingosinicella sp. GR2756]